MDLPGPSIALLGLWVQGVRLARRTAIREQPSRAIQGPVTLRPSVGLSGSRCVFTPTCVFGRLGCAVRTAGGWGKGITCLLAESCHLRPLARAQPAQTQLEGTSLLPGRSHQVLLLNLLGFRNRSCWGCTSVLGSSHHVQLSTQPVSEHRPLSSSLDTPCPAGRVPLMCRPAYTMGPRLGANTCLDAAVKVILDEINIHIRRV